MNKKEQIEEEQYVKDCEQVLDSLKTENTGVIIETDANEETFNLDDEVDEKLEKKTFRSVCLRVSAVNEIKKENEKLGVKAGDTVTYTFEDFFQMLEGWVKTKAIKFFAIKHDEDANNVHFHAVITFPEKSEVTFKTLKSKFPYGSIQRCRRGVHACVQYLTHYQYPEKAQYPWSAIETNAPDLLEVYKIPTKATEKKILTYIVDQIITGKIKEYEITTKIKPEIYVKFAPRIKNALDFAYKRKIQERQNRAIQVIVLQGPSQVGKSTFCRVYAELNNKSIAFSSGSNDMLESMADEDIFVVDDNKHTGFNLQDMLKLLDPHIGSLAPSRYKNKMFLGDTLFICTNVPILGWYAREDSASRRAFFSRISCVLDFESLSEDKVASYTVNEIVFNNGNVPSLKKLRDCTFDLKKYVDFSIDEKKKAEFIGGLSDM